VAEFYSIREKEMNNVRIENGNQLQAFLSALLKEEIAGEQREMVRSIKDGMGKYTTIEEQDEAEGEDEEDSPIQRPPNSKKPPPDEAEEAEEADEADEAPDKEEAPKEEKAEAPSEEKAEAPSEESDEEEVSPDVTYFKVRDEINNIRSAPSLKGKKEKQEMEQWLSRLSDVEKKLLFNYLTTVNSIMHGKVSGSEAQDPSDPPSSINIPQKTPGGEAADGETEEDVEIIMGDEDTTPPIKTGERQDLKEITRRAKLLMRA
jgi:hypothetical protein